MIRHPPYWSAMFLVFALAAGLCGFGGIAGPTAWLAEALCVVLVALAALVFAQRLTERGAPTEPPELPDPSGDRPFVE